jgi:hypothetical protein
MSKDARDSALDEQDQVLMAGSSIGEAATSTASAAISTVKKTVVGPESEGKRWRRAFDSNAMVVNGER